MRLPLPRGATAILKAGAARGLENLADLRRASRLAGLLVLVHSLGGWPELTRQTTARPLWQPRQPPNPPLGDDLLEPGQRKACLAYLEGRARCSRCSRRRAALVAAAMPQRRAAH